VRTSEPTLDELAQRIRASDRDAFSEAFTRLKEPLVRYVQRFTPDVPTAYDVLQDVFANLWEGRAKLAENTTLKGLVYTMARNRAFNLNRRSARISETDVTEALDRVVTAPPGDAVFEAHYLEAQIHRWISELPPRRAEAFILSRYHGLKYKDISTIMGLSERTVQTHVLHAMRDLRMRLKTLQQ
jgi:RNA polymerase sigma-70 factor (ECF subfamily)